MKNFTFLIFVAITFCCWGTYGPTLHIGQKALGADGQLSLLRSLICVGVAYFLIAVLVPTIVLLTRGETGGWTMSGFCWSFIAGSLGALGALGITLAFKFKGSPIYVKPLVFGCAPIVNTFVTMFMSGTFRQARGLFFVGILVVAVGAAGVLLTKPTQKKAAAIDSPTISEVASSVVTGEAKPISLSEAQVSSTVGQLTMVVLSVLLAASCWGSYGAVLHRGQALMKGSRLRPFICVGLAYFAIAVLVPSLLLPVFPEPGQWLTDSDLPGAGIGWSLIAGSLGAVGALGIIYAFNFGGKPIFVMPLVFGFAPVINTLVETASKGLLDQIDPLFYPSLAMVITGAVMVLIFAPRPPAPVKK